MATVSLANNEVIKYVSAGTNSVSSGTVQFSNSNGVSFGMDTNGVVTASHNGLTTARASNDAIGLNTAQSNVTWTANSSGLSLDARGYAGTGTSATNASVTLNSNGLAISVAAPGAATATVYGVGNTTVNSSGTVPLSAMSIRGYGVLSVGTSNGSVLFSTPDAVDFTQFSGGFSTGGNTAGDTGLVTGRLVLAGGANITLSGSTNGGSQTISIVGGAGGGGGVGLSAGTQSVSTGTVVYSNSNNISFGMSGSSRVTAQAALNLYATGNTTNNSSTQLGIDVVSLNAQGALTAGFSNGSVQLSAPATSSLSAGANITISTNGSTISIIGASVAASPLSFSAGTTSSALQSIVFSNSNGVSFGLNGSTVTASHNGLTTAAQSNHSHGDPTLALTNLSGTTASASNGLTLSLSAAAQSAQPVAVSGSNGSFAFSTVTLGSSNGMHFYTTNGSVVGSYTVPSTAGLLSAVNVSAGTTSNNLSALTFANANGITFGLNASTVTASHNGLTTAAASDHSHGNPTLNLTNLSGTTASNSAGFTLSLSAAAPGGGAPAASASNGSFTFSTLGFSNANNVTFGTSAGSIITASVAAPGAAAENNNINLLGANTAGNTTASGSTIGWSGQGVTLSGNNGSNIVISAPATSSLSATGAVSISTNGSTISIGAPAEITLSGYLEAFIDRELLAAQIGNNQLFVQPMNLRHPAQWEEVAWLNNYSNASNSSNSATLTLQVGVYSRTGSSLSIITSNSSSYAVTNSGTVGSYSIYGGLREYPIPMTTTLPAGNYFMGFLSRTTTGGGAGMTWSNFVASNINSAYSGRWSSANNATNQFAMGLGSYTATTTALPNSIGLSQINGSAAINLRPVIYKLVSADLN